MEENGLEWRGNSLVEEVRYIMSSKGFYFPKEKGLDEVVEFFNFESLRRWNNRDLTYSDDNL